ncbi:MAG: hypothetical protein MUC48_09405 [Leptolyngbya sp. Prado105]|nr:hypothetical protein [Leptolyngbya sp. Prado105]
MAEISPTASFFLGDVMSNHVENTHTCPNCAQEIAIAGLDSSQCSKCKWVELPGRTATSSTQSTRRKASSKPREGHQIDLFDSFGGLS